MITKDYVSFETAKLLKDKGFDEPCTHFYEFDKKLYNDMGDYFPSGMRNSDFDKKSTRAMSAPTYKMVIKWLIEVHHIYASPVQQGNHNDFSENYTWIVSRDGIIYRNKTVSEKLSYEEACEAAVKYSLENLI